MKSEHAKSTTEQEDSQNSYYLASKNKFDLSPRQNFVGGDVS